MTTPKTSKNPQREKKGLFDPSPSKRRAAYRLWFDFIVRNKWKYILGFGSIILTSVMQVLGSRSLGWTLDFFTEDSLPVWLSGSDQQSSFIRLLVFLLAIRLFLLLGRWVWRLTFARQTHYAASELKSKIWTYGSKLRARDLQSTFTKGLMMNASTSDAASGRLIFGFTLVAFFDVIFLTFFTIWAMLAIDSFFTVAALSALIALPPLIKWLSEREIIRYVMVQDFLSHFNDLTSQAVSTIGLQRMTHTGLFWKRQLDAAARKHRELRLSAAQTSLMFIPTIGLGSLVSYIVLFTLGLHYVFIGKFTLGDFIAMQALIFLIQNPLFELGFIISEWRKGVTSLQRLVTIYNHPSEPFLAYTTSAPKKFTSDIVIALKDVTFRYPNSSRAILNNYSIDLKRCERLGIMGSIGAGKSTLVAIMAGLERDIERGKVKFFDFEFDQYSHPDLRQVISMVPQKPFLFADTIAANIKMDLILSDEQIWHALWVAGLDEDVKTFPLQLATPLGEWGVNLSGGQKQRLSLARAFARGPKVLFMDDCLSAVDTVTEEKILDRLNRELEDLSAVWVAHRESTLKYCDRIIRLDGVH